MRGVIDEIRHLMAAYEPRPVSGDWRREAGVLVPLYELDGALHVVFTRRSDDVEHHRGEISFPGGGREPTDEDLSATALRESDEEIGLRAADVEILGELDEMVTVSNYHVRPYVGLIDPASSPYKWVRHEREVAEIIEVPLAHLLNPVNREISYRELPGGRQIREAFRFHDHLIWGATARMLANFLTVITPAVPSEPGVRPAP